MCNHMHYFAEGVKRTGPGRMGPGLGERDRGVRMGRGLRERERVRMVRMGRGLMERDRRARLGRGL
jgi:hypothetical protein